MMQGQKPTGVSTGFVVVVFLMMAVAGWILLNADAIREGGESSPSAGQAAWPYQDEAGQPDYLSQDARAAMDRFDREWAEARAKADQQVAETLRQFKQDSAEIDKWEADEYPFQDCVNEGDK